jgi:glucose-1-phosphate thymidylyltransferase
MGYLYFVDTYLLNNTTGTPGEPMQRESLKIVIPMAGFGTRLRPHTWSKPKPLVSTGGKTVLAHVLDMFSTLPDPENVELVFIIGYLGDQVAPYMQEHYPHVKAHYVLQEERRGQSHAIYLAREHLSGPMLMAFVDTIIETDLSVIAESPTDAYTWVQPVEDPRRFGVAEVKESGYVSRLVEKPQDMSNNLVLVGFYYFPSAENLLSAIEEQMEKGIMTKGEYYLADAVNLMLQSGLQMRTQKVDVWLDAGVPETVLETNRYLLDNGRGNSDEITGREASDLMFPLERGAWWRTAMSATPCSNPILR